MNGSGKTLLVLGGTSDVGRATALAFASKGWSIQLAGRDLNALRREADDIAARADVAVTTHGFDVLATSSFAVFVGGLPKLPNAVVSVVGLLGDQAKAQTDLEHATTIMRSNFEGPALIMSLFAERFIARGGGTIVGVSSVAGDRGRASNYIYGAAKAGLTAFLSGLRNRAAKHGVHVVTVKPGFVRTRMTDGLKLPSPLTAEPKEVADAILRSVIRQRNVVYVRSIWLPIMGLIRSIPESIFKQLSL